MRQQSRRAIGRDVRERAHRRWRWAGLGGLAALVALFVVPLPAAAAGKPILAVFDISAAKKTRLKRDLLRSLTDYLANQLTGKGVYQVVPRDTLASRIRKQKISSYKKCIQQSCQIAIGKELAANKSLSTKIAKIGKICLMTATLYDLRTAASERAASAKGKCSEEALLKAVETVAAQLSGDQVPTASTTAPPSGDVKLATISSAAAIRVAWPPRCSPRKPQQCFALARRMKEQDQALVLALFAYVQARRTANWRISNRASKYVTRLMQGYVPRQTQLEAMLAGACRRRAGACYAAAKLKQVEKRNKQRLGFLKRACDKNELAACTALGTVYRLGSGVTKNPSKAIALYRRACDRRYLPGCASLAYVYRYGHGVPKNESRALALYRRACDRRYWAACQSLGSYYSYGTAKNYSKAVAVYRRACDGGHPQSCSSLAYMYKMGRGVAKNLAKSNAIYSKACKDGYVYGCTASGDHTRALALRGAKCDNGDLYACNNLAYMYKQGRGVAKNLAKAAAIYRRSCELGNISACISSGNQTRVTQLYQRGCDGGNMYNCNAVGDRYRYGKGTTLNKYKSVQMYRKACNGGYAYACNNLAYMYKYGYGVRRDTSMARSIYMRACKKGNMSACRNAKAYGYLATRYRQRCSSGSMYDCNMLGVKYSRGEGVSLNSATAVGFFRRSCSGGYMQGCANLAAHFRSGRGITRNETQAKYYFRRACAGGFRSACAKVTVCQPGQYRNSFGRCVRSGRSVSKRRCAPGTYWSTTHRHCEPLCRPGFYYNTRSRRCMRSSSATRCSTGFYYNTYSRRCVRRCSTGWYWNTTSRRCMRSSGAKCRPGHTLYRAKNRKAYCCPPGTKGYYSGYTRISCRRTYGSKKCGYGYFWNYSLRRCKRRCRIGWYWSASLRRCKRSAGKKKCGYGYFWSYSLRRCKRRCRAGWYWSASRNRCKRSTYRRRGTCSAGWYWSASLRRCIRKPGCKPGFVRRGNLCVRRGLHM